MKNFLKACNFILIFVLLLSQMSYIAYATEESYFKPSDILMYYVTDMNKDDEWEVAEKTHAGYMGSAHVPINGSDNDISETARLTGNILKAHEHGIKYIYRISTDMEMHNDGKGFACVDVLGKLITTSMGEENPRPWYSIHHPDNRATMLSMFKKVIDNGADGFAIDSYALNYDVLDARNGDFSEYSMLDFRKYLSEKYKPQVLKEQGISDINSFDYGEFIRNGYLEQYQKYKNDVPFYMDFKKFQLKSCLEFWSGIIDDLDAYGKAKGKNLCFLDNNPESNSINNADMIYGFPLAAKLDAFCSEYNFGYPPEDGSTAVFKLFQGIGTPLALIANSGMSADLLSRSDVTQLMKLQTAEAYASGGYRYVPFKDVCLDINNQWTTFSANMEEMYPYYDFIDANKSYYNNTDSKASVGLFYSYEAMIQEGIKDKETFTLKDFYSASSVLLNAHVQYDVLFGGDDEFVKDELDYNNLKKYSVIIIPGSHYLNQKHLKLLQEYVKKGGKVITTGSEGNPSWIKVKKISQLASNRLITANAGMKTSVDSKVYINRSWNTKYNAEIIQVVNKDYDIKLKKNNIKKNVAFELKLNKKLSGKKLSVRYHSPDGALVSNIKYKLQNGTIHFSVPEIQTYGVVTVSEAGKLEAGLSIEALENAISQKEEKSEAESISFDLSNYRKALSQACVFMNKNNYQKALSISSNTAMSLEADYNKMLADKSMVALKEKLVFSEKSGRTYGVADAKAALIKAQKQYELKNYATADALAGEAIDKLSFSIDGKIDDWEGISPLKVELEKSSDSKGLQINEAYCYNDDEYLYFALKINNANNPHCNFSLRCNGDVANEYQLISAYKDGSGNGSVIDRGTGVGKELPVSLKVCAGDYYELRVPIELFKDCTYFEVDVHSLNFYYPENWQNGDVVKFRYNVIK